MYTSLLILVLMTAQTLLRPVRTSVSLTVEGGVSLVGPHCPGTVRLFCEGVDLTTFRWIYNGNINIGDLYHPDDSINDPSSTSNPAFVSVQLTAVSQSLLNPVFGNFYSILTVDLSQLEQQNIKNISCDKGNCSSGCPHCTRDCTSRPSIQYTKCSVGYYFKFENIHCFSYMDGTTTSKMCTIVTNCKLIKICNVYTRVLYALNF